MTKQKMKNFGEAEYRDCLPKELMNNKEKIKCTEATKERLDSDLKQKQNEQVQKIRKYKTSSPKRGHNQKIPNEEKSKKKQHNRS